jgi:surface protein
MDELAKMVRDILTSAAATAAAEAAAAAADASAAAAAEAAASAAADSLDEDISDELRDLLASIKLTKYVPKFIENDLLTLETMLVLSEEELKEDLGLPRASARTIHNAATMAMQKRQESTSAIFPDSSTVPPPSLTPFSSLGNSSITTPAHVAEIQSEIVESDTSEIDTELLDPRLIRSDEDIEEAVQLWCSDRTAAESLYGDIRYWSTSRVTNTKKLFERCSDFNDDISRWDVSSVTDMSGMFYGASAFNQELKG